MIKMTLTTVDVHADTAVDRISEHATLEDAHYAGSTMLQAGCCGSEDLDASAGAVRG
jgi:hypothetical protein